LRNLQFDELSMQTDPIGATERRSGRSFTESRRDGQFDELCKRNGGPLAQRVCSNNFLFLFDTKTLNSLGGCRIPANTIDESDQQ